MSRVSLVASKLVLVAVLVVGTAMWGLVVAVGVGWLAADAPVGKGLLIDATALFIVFLLQLRKHVGELVDRLHGLGPDGKPLP